MKGREVLGKGQKKQYSKSFVGVGRNGNIDERIDKVIKLGAEPGEVDEIGVVLGLGSAGGGGGGGGRKLGEERKEERLKGEKGFEGVMRRRRRGDEGEEDRKVVDVSPGRKEQVA